MPELTTSDIIQIIGILASLLTSIIAIVISICTLRQNSRMIEDSTRPYIGIYGAETYIGSPHYYLVIKNFGQSSAFIRSFTYDFDLSQCVNHDFDSEPFQNIENSTLMPGQSFRCVIDYNKTLASTKIINFHILYSSGMHSYEDDICVNLTASIGNVIMHNTTQNKELKIISETLQDMYIHSL